MEDLGYANMIIKRGILGLGRRIMVTGKGKLKEIANKIKKSISQNIFSTRYEEIVIKASNKLVFEGQMIRQSKGSSIVVVARTGIFYTFTPSTEFKKMFLLNKKILEEIYSNLYR